MGVPGGNKEPPGCTHVFSAVVVEETCVRAAYGLGGAAASLENVTGAGGKGCLYAFGVIHKRDDASSVFAEVELNAADDSVITSSRQRDLFFVLEDPCSVETVAKTLKLCSTFGVTRLCLVFDKTPEIDHTSDEMGLLSSATNKRVAVDVFASIDECFDALPGEARHIGISSDGASGTDLDSASFLEEGELGIVVLWGGDGCALSDNAVAGCSGLVHVPSMGADRSIDDSLAHALVLAEVSRQRRASKLNFMLEI